MKRGMLLSSAATGMIAVPAVAQAPQSTAVEAPLRISVAAAGEAKARVTVGTASFVLPDERDAMSAALKAMPDKDRPVTIAVEGKVDAPYRVIGGVLYLVQSAGFTKASVVSHASDD